MAVTNSANARAEAGEAVLAGRGCPSEIGCTARLSGSSGEERLVSGVIWGGFGGTVFGNKFVWNWCRKTSSWNKLLEFLIKPDLEDFV